MNKIKRTLMTLIQAPGRAMDATDAWVARLGYQGRHWAAA